MENLKLINRIKIYKRVFLVATFYNILWGIWVIFYPNMLIEWLGMAPLNHPYIMSCVGMLVAVYGYGYWVLYNNPMKYPQLVVIGLIGKCCGIIGMTFHILIGNVPEKTFIMIVTNDLVWLPFFIDYLIWHKKHRLNLNTNLLDNTLYQQLLGKKFDLLPNSLKYFHGKTNGGKGKGVFQVVCGHSVIKKILAKLLCLPPNGENVQVSLSVKVKDNKEYWIRKFNGFTLKTVSWKENDLLIEKSGVLKFLFQLVPFKNGIQYRFKGLYLFGIKIPPKISLQIHASAFGNNSDWYVKVYFIIPLLGMITKYSGTIKPQSCK